MYMYILDMLKKYLDQKVRFSKMEINEWKI